MTLISDKYWVAASDIGREPGQFYWNDGTIVDNDWWNVYQPDETGPEKKTCAVILGKKLYDENCNYYKHKYICEVGKEYSECF
jgi:hypothetical protein